METLRSAKDPVSPEMDDEPWSDGWADEPPTRHERDAADEAFDNEVLERGY